MAISCGRVQGLRACGSHAGRQPPQLCIRVARVTACLGHWALPAARRSVHASKFLCRAAGDERVGLRAEAEAPWRTVRIVLFSFSVVSASLGFLISLPQLAGALGGAPNALSLEQVGTNLGINGSVIGLFLFLLKRDFQARDKQLARLSREEVLSKCKIQLANGKVLQLASVQGSARVVLIAGTPSQVQSNLDAAEPFKVELCRRGVLVIPLPIYEDAAGPSDLGTLASEDLRWKAHPVQMEAWKKWFETQLSFGKATSERGLYVSLRKDGRVRGSGKGCPPWEVLVAQLPPDDGMWSGLLDGMDGRV
mmetsp:Transcript_4400/g.7255  ORF Transcript_4400/g.7255 Transcript_4400/m.7255 type:complete len:308 (+) Transcript_4400:2-925(+)